LPEVPDSEYQALVDFYNATDGNNWLNKWDVSVNNLSQGAWYGLVIENGHIAEINLGSNRLSGAIPASFSNLKQLRKLDLNLSYNYYNRNDLSSTNLDNISSLESLEELDLSYCQLSGAIPSSWGQLTKLKSLVLSNNTFTNVPIALGNLNSLEVLDLSHNAIVDSGADFSSSTFTNFDLRYQDINIESIEIGANEINIDLPTSLNFQLNNGQVTIDANNEFRLYVNGTHQRTAFSNSGKLNFFNINVLNLQITDKLRVYQVNGISAYSNINYNTLTFGPPLVDGEFEILKKIYEATNGDTWTNSWDISENNLNIESWFGVSTKGGHVVSLNLSSNNLTGVLPEEITGLSQLKSLSLNGNLIGGNIPGNINLLTNLETLDLGSNLLNGTIPKTISDLQKLKKFAIGNNKFKGTIPSQLSDFIDLEYLDLSNNSFNKIEKKLYYDYSKTYIDLRNQIINHETVLNLEGSQLKVVLDNIVKYDLENNNYEAKNNFVLLVDNIIHTSTTANDSGEIIFDDVRIGEISSNAKISIRQATGTFRNTEFIFLGIEDKSNIPILEKEYLAIVEIFNALNGDQWTNKWDTTSNNLHINKWFGVSTYDGHIISLDLSSNNLSGSIPNIFDALPYLNTLNISSNKLTGIDAVLPVNIDFTFDRQTIEAGDIDLNINTIISDFAINRYEHMKNDFFNQTYNLNVGNFSKTLNLSEEGVKLMDLLKIWKVPNGQKLELRQISGDSKNSTINYYLKYRDGDSNLDSALNVLDIQTSINYMLNNYVNYFNFNAADIDNNNNINVLDISKQVNIIQNQEPSSKTTDKSNLLGSNKNGEDTAKISLENGLLTLETNGKKVTSFEIFIKNITKENIDEFISSKGFTVSIVHKDNYVNIIGYSFNNVLEGKIELARISSKGAVIQSILLSNISANEIPSQIMESTLGINDLESEKFSYTYNFPNPFRGETTINFYLRNNTNNAILSIFNLRGRIIKNIEIGKFTAGENQYLFKQENMSSGVYIYILSFIDQAGILKGKMIIE
ncbi:hypothetical protein I3217_04530, partial [Formosa sp. S-31]